MNSLQEIVTNFFATINTHIINTLSQVFEANEFKKDYKRFVEYCIQNPTFIFDAIDYIYPYIDNDDDNNNFKYIQALKLGFDKNPLIKSYLCKYSDKFLTLLKQDAISNAVGSLLKLLLIDLHVYHNIYKRDSAATLTDLLTKEYLYRKKINT